MPKRSPKSSGGTPHVVLFLGGLALILFVSGEALVLSRTDAGLIVAAKHLHVGDRAQVTRLVGRQIRHGLDAFGVSPDSIRESVIDRATPPLRWRVGLPADASLLQANYAVTRSVEDGGAEVLSGREHAGRWGESVVTLVVGLPGRPTHQIDLVRSLDSSAPEAPGGGRLAVVVFGFGDDPELTTAFLRLHEPFAVALAPGTPTSESFFREAHEEHREVVLHLPLEPVHYPQVSPGPGTLLVTMSPTKIGGLLRHYLDQAGPIAGVANSMGSLATQDIGVMSAVYEELRRRRLPFLHMNPAPGALCKSLAADLGVAYREADAVLDDETRKDGTKALETSWKHAIARAHDHGEALVLVRGTPLTLRWLPDALAAKKLDGVKIVPAADLLHRPAI